MKKPFETCFHGLVEILYTLPLMWHFLYLISWVIKPFVSLSHPLLSVDPKKKYLAKLIISIEGAFMEQVSFYYGKKIVDRTCAFGWVVKICWKYSLRDYGWDEPIFIETLYKVLHFIVMVAFYCHGYLFTLELPSAYHHHIIELLILDISLAVISKVQECRSYYHGLSALLCKWL